MNVSPTLRENLVTLNVFAALKMMLFPMAVITLFWKDQVGLSLTEILTIQVFFSVASVAMEYPSGYVSDRLGYKPALVIACLFALAGWGGYIWATSFWSVLGAELLLGVSYAFISGSDTALLFEVLRAEGRADLYARCDGRMVAWGQIGEASGALFAGIMYAWSPFLPFLAQLAVWGLALLLCARLAEPIGGKGPQIESHLAEALAICRFALVESPGIRSIIVFATLLGLASFYMVWFIQPFMQRCEVPLAWFGPVWAGANAVVALCSAWSYRVRRRLGLRGMSMLFGLLIVSAYLGLGLTADPASFLFYYLLTAMRGLQGPAIRTLLQQSSDRRNRASILSLQSLVFRLGFVFTGPIVGWTADTFGFDVVFLCLGGCFTLCLPVTGWFFLKHNLEIAAH